MDDHGNAWLVAWYAGVEEGDDTVSSGRHASSGGFFGINEAALLRFLTEPLFWFQVQGRLRKHFECF